MPYRAIVGDPWGTQVTIVLPGADAEEMLARCAVRRVSGSGAGR